MPESFTFPSQHILAISMSPLKINYICAENSTLTGIKENVCCTFMLLSDDCVDIYKTNTHKCKD